MATLFIAAALVPVLQRAWVTQDAFITLRYVENFHAGHGLVFNVGERVQGFTHPLWAMLLCASPPEYVVHSAILYGLLCTALALAGAAAAFRSLGAGPAAFALLCILLVPSRSFREWSTSGLENGLLHAAVAWTFVVCLSVQPRPFLLGLSCAAVLLTRVDHGPLIFAVACTSAWRFANQIGFRRTIWRGALGLTPLFVWLTFAAIYYGFPLPNTSYAKLGGFTLGQRLQHGIDYVLDFIRCEPAHGAFIALSIGILPLLWRNRSREARIAAALGSGVVLQLACLIYIGGDYMRGRFMTAILLAACMTLVSGLHLLAAKRRLVFGAAVGVGMAILVVSYPTTTTELGFDGRTGIARISATYSPLSWVEHPKLSLMRQQPRSLSRLAAYNEKYNSQIPTSFRNLGDDTFGFGATVPIVDLWGLTDPFVSRCKASGRNRPGHVQRNVPRAYLRARGCMTELPNWAGRLEQGDPTLVADAETIMRTPGWLDARAAEAFHEIDLLTRGPLFSADRLRLVLKYTFTRPLAYDNKRFAPAIDASEVPELLTIASELKNTIRFAGAEPSQYSYYEPRETRGFWLGPAGDGDACLFLDAAKGANARVAIKLEFGAAIPDTRTCTFAILSGESETEYSIGRPGVYYAPVTLREGRNAIRLRVLDPAGPHRFYLDPRPLMVYLSQVKIVGEDDKLPAGVAPLEPTSRTAQAR